jgi:hypothetical protein
MVPSLCRHVEQGPIIAVARYGDDLLERMVRKLRAGNESVDALDVACLVMLVM